MLRHRRYDWFAIKEIKSSYDEILEAARDRDINRTQEAFTSFKMTTITSHDLLDHDANRLIGEVDKYLKNILPMMGTAAKADMVPLRQLREMDLYHITKKSDSFSTTSRY